MTSFPAFQCLLFVLLLIQQSVCSKIELDRLNKKLNVLTLKQESTQEEMKLLQDEVEQLRNEAQQARQQANVAQLEIKQLQDEVEQLKNEAQQTRQQVNVSGEVKMTGSGETKCSCETAVNLTNELQDIRHHRINESERILKLESFSRKWTDELTELKSIASTVKILMMGFRQEKQRRKYFEMRIDTDLYAINDTIFSMNQTCQSSSLRKDIDSSIEEMNFTLHRLLVDMEGIKSSIRNIQNDTSVLFSTSHSQSVILTNSSNTTWRNDAEIRQIYSELQTLKGVIANMPGGQTSSSTIASTKSVTSHLCARTVTDETLILASIKVGSRVVRGRDWVWENQDGVPPTAGTVKKVESLPGWVWVRWDRGMSYNYRVGDGAKFDLYICE